MSRTLSQILTDVNAFVDLEATLPTGSELTLRTNYANQAVIDATAVAQLPELKATYSVDPSTLASISLPSNFNGFSVAPKQNINGGWTSYEQIEPEERYSKESSDDYCYVLGNPQDGYTAIFNGHEPNTTLYFDYQKTPSGFATLTSVCEFSDPTYVTSKVESYILQSRSDDRFPIIEAEAQRKLKNMVGRSMRKPGGGTNTIRKMGTANYVLE